jgi:uncharacterized cupredoxin-like copper-binding protein
MRLVWLLLTRPPLILKNMENATKNSPKLNAKMIGIILAAVVLVVLIAVIISTGSKKSSTSVGGSTTTTANNEAAPSGTVNNTNTATTTTNGQVVPEGARVEVVGANAVTKDNIVITKTGEVAKNDVIPMSPQAPQQTAPITKAQLPNTALKLDVSATGFSPKEITAKAGSPVTLSVSSTDGLTHVFMFDDNALAAVAIGVGPSETRAITFNAPAKAGTYTFRCDVPGHFGRGEVGALIVK